MHADSLLIQPNFSSKLMITWLNLFENRFLIRFQIDRKCMVTRLINCSKFHFRSTFISSNWIKSGFSNKMSHAIINFEDKFGWIKSESTCICFTWLPPSHTLLGQKLDPRVTLWDTLAGLLISILKTNLSVSIFSSIFPMASVCFWSFCSKSSIRVSSKSSVEFNFEIFWFTSLNLWSTDDDNASSWPWVSPIAPARVSSLACRSTMLAWISSTDSSKETTEPRVVKWIARIAIIVKKTQFRN